MKKALHQVKALVVIALCASGICMAQAKYIKPGISINGKVPTKDGTYAGYTYKNGVFTLNTKKKSQKFTFAGKDTSGKVRIVVNKSCTIVLKDGFTLDLRKLTESSGETSAKLSPISLSGSTTKVHVRAEGQAHLYGAKRGAGLLVTGSQTVYVESTDSGCLYAHGGNSAAGIGSGYMDKGCGTINIKGKVVAKSSKRGCGIGMGEDCTGNGTVNIDSEMADVEATGCKAPAIGTCDGHTGNMTIRIKSGKVTAKCNSGGCAAIGTGEKARGTCDIAITGGTVEAKANGSKGAGIGTGEGSTAEMNIKITEGCITAHGGKGSAGIGGGYMATTPAITILGGTITAKGDPDDDQAMDIGAGSGGTGTETCEVRGGSIRLNKGKGNLTRNGIALNVIKITNKDLKKWLKEKGAKDDSAADVDVSLTTSEGRYYSDGIVLALNVLDLFLWVPPAEYTFTVKISARNSDVTTVYYADVRKGNCSKPEILPICTVSFDANGGSPTPASVQRDKGMAFGPLSAISSTPTWANHKFIGWYTQREGGTKLASSTIIQGNCTYYAQWRELSAPAPVECVIHFYGLNSEVFTSITGERGKAIGPMPVLEKPGYRFKGWKRSGDGVTLSENTTFNYTVDYASAQWEEITATANGYTWRYCVENGEAIIVKSESWHQPAVTTSPSGAVTVPSTLGGYPVTAIGDAAFYDCSGMTSVTIPATVTTIGDYAFYNCTGLTTVNIPESVTTIGDDAFYYCTNLRSVTGMAGVTEIGYLAFCYTGLTELTLPEGVETIWNGAFCYCKSLATVNIPASLTEIGAEAFLQCTGLTNLNMADADRRYGVRAFCGCSGLADGDFVVVDGILFYYLGSDSHVTVPAGVWRIDDTAFPGKKFTSVTLPESLSSIGVNAFSGTGLKTVLFALDAGTVDDKAAQIDRIKDEFAHAGVNVNNITFDAPTAGVRYYGNGGKPTYSEEIKPVGVALGELPVATRSGYLFLGWYTAYGTKATAATIATGDDAFFAKWTPAWTVTLNANGGTVSPTKVLIAKGKAVGSALPVPTRTGYSFVAWYTKKSGGVSVTSKTKVTKSVTYYARWKANNYPITLQKNGNGSVSGGGNKPYKSTVTLKATPASDSVFMGWFIGDTFKSRKTSYSITVPLDGATYTAVFVTKVADRESIGLGLCGVGVGSLETTPEATLPDMSGTKGIVTTWPVTATALTPVSVTVTGLPTGLKYDASKNAITGVPSVSGSGTMKFTAKSSGGSRTWTAKWSVAEMPTTLRGSFNGWTYTDGNPSEPKRKVTVSVTSVGKISASVGSLKFSRTGWTARDDGHYVATLRTVRTTTSGSTKKKFTDILTLDIAPNANWMTDQLVGSVGTFSGDVTVAKAQTLTPSNTDPTVSARRNSYNDVDDAKELAAWFSSWLGTNSSFNDESGTKWNIKASTAGVVTISRTTGTGKNKKTITATAVLEVSEAGAYTNYSARFLASGKLVVFSVLL